MVVDSESLAGDRMPKKRARIVCIVGPDGVGKSSVSVALAQRAPRGALWRYWRPGALPGLSGGSTKTLGADVNRDPHGRVVNGVFRTFVRQVYYFLDFVVGHFLIYRPALNAGRDVIVERGYDDMIVDPRRYLFRSTRLLRFLRPFVPPPDITLVLVGDAKVIWLRKAELTREEIARQTEAWRRLDVRRQKIIVDARRPVKEVVEEVVQILW